MTYQKGTDFNFDSESYSSEIFIGELLRAEYGAFPVRKRDPDSNDLVSVEVPAVQTEIENISRIMPFNYTETYEDKRGARSKITMFQEAYQKLGFRSLKQIATQKYFEYERKRVLLGTRPDGQEIVIVFSKPIRAVSKEEAATIKKARDLVAVEAEEGEFAEGAPAKGEPAELSYQEAYLLGIMGGLTPKALVATAEDDPVITADSSFMEAVKAGTIQKKLEKSGKIVIADGRYKVSE